MMTEQEAKKKWCPFARLATQLNERTPINCGGHNRSVFWNGPLDEDVVNNPEFCRCIASDCMAWRNIKASQKRFKPRGYCGLAGKP